MQVGERSSGATMSARAWAAAYFMPSVICTAPQDKAPLNRPGKTSTLLIWLGKSDRPVPTTAAPWARASSGMISGTGLAMARITESLAIVSTMAPVTRPGRETPMNTSAPTKASARVPVRFSGLVRAASSSWWLGWPGVPGTRMPSLSHRVRWRYPRSSNSLAAAPPAAPMPLRTIFTSSFFLPTTFRALVRAAVITTAVPCWSS